MCVEITARFVLTHVYSSVDASGSWCKEAVSSC